MYSTSARLEATAKSAECRLLAVQHALRDPGVHAVEDLAGALAIVALLLLRDPERHQHHAGHHPPRALVRREQRRRACRPRRGRRARRDLREPAEATMRRAHCWSTSSAQRSASRARGSSDTRRGSGYHLVQDARQLARALRAAPVLELHRRTRSPGKPYQAHEHSVRTRREVHAAELDPLVLEHQLAGATACEPGIAYSVAAHPSTRLR